MRGKKGKKCSQNCLNVFQQAFPALCLFVRLVSVILCFWGFSLLDFTRYKQLRWPRWPTWLEQLRSFLRRCSLCIFTVGASSPPTCQMTFTLPGPRLLPLVHQWSPLTGKIHLTHGETISLFPHAFFFRLLSDCLGGLTKTSSLLSRPEKCEQGGVLRCNLQSWPATTSSLLATERSNLWQSKWTINQDNGLALEMHLLNSVPLFGPNKLGPRVCQALSPCGPDSARCKFLGAALLFAGETIEWPLSLATRTSSRLTRETRD